MSHQNKYIYMPYSARIERLINEKANSFQGLLNPHIIIEPLKKPCDDISDLSELGRLIQESLEDSSALDKIRWVVFHFDLPVEYLRGDEIATRNWVSIRVAEQALLEEVHNPVIAMGTTRISNIYAPSVLSKKLKYLNNPLGLREKSWLYHFEREPLDKLQKKHKQCQKCKIIDNDLLCVMDDGEEYVHIFSCNANQYNENGYICTLGRLLGEEEAAARSKYKAFVEIIKKRSSSEFPRLADSDIQIQCNYYARIPVFFGSEPQRYMTEVFVAFNDPKKDTLSIVNTLKNIEWPLRFCVSMINSHIAYTMGDIAREHKISQLILQVVGHGLGNWAAEAIANANLSVSSLPKNSSGEKAMFYLNRLIADCGIGALSAIGLKLYKQNKYIDIESMLTFISDEAMLNCVIDIDTNHRTYHCLIPGRTYFVLAELIENALKVQRNNRFSAKLTFKIELLEEGKLVQIELINIGKLGEIQKILNDINRPFPQKKRGCWLCAKLVSEVGGTITWEDRDGSVSVRVTMPTRDFEVRNE